MARTVVRAGRHTGEQSRQPVVLVHGLGRGTGSMLPLSWRLEAAGFNCWRIGYPSQRLDIDEATDLLIAALEPLLESGRPLHLVGHSLGGLLSHGIGHRLGDRIGRVVMIGSPMLGSEVAVRAGRVLPLRWVFGPVFPSLATVRPAPQVFSRAGAIVGDTWPGLPGCLLGVWGPGDGTVSRPSAEAGAADTVAVDCGHLFLPVRKEVARLTARFLETGRFDEADPRDDRLSDRP